MKRFIALFATLFISISTFAQSDYFQNRRREFASFIEKRQSEFARFRDSVNLEYTKFMRSAWQKYYGEEPIPAPEVEPVPVIDYENEPKPKPIESKPIEFEIEEIPPVVIEEPVPLPIEPQPVIKDEPVDKLNLKFLSSPLSFRIPKHRPALYSQDENGVADMWEELASSFNPTLSDLFQARKDMALCDWAYLELCGELAGQVYKDSSEEAVLEAFLLAQSGFKLRLARDKENRIHYLISTNRLLCGKSYFILDGENYFLVNENLEELYIFNRSFSQEQALRLEIKEEMNLVENTDNCRALTADAYPELFINVCVNKNLIDFYNTYPSSMRTNDAGSKWQLYAQTPVSSAVQEQLYPQLRRAIKGKTELEAVNMLLNLVQTGFTYGYDMDVWACGDRPFFAEETLYYPYSDCEDRAILYSHLIRDLLGLDVVLLYYPNHLATAVCFNEYVEGDYLLYDGKRYIVCDPTYIHAPVGLTMKDMDNSVAKIIVL